MLSYFLSGFHWKKMGYLSSTQTLPALAKVGSLWEHSDVSLFPAAVPEETAVSVEPCFASSYCEIAVCGWNSGALICCEIKFQCYSGFLAFISVLINDFRFCFLISLLKVQKDGRTGSWINLVNIYCPSRGNGRQVFFNGSLKATLSSSPDEKRRYFQTL